MLPIRITFAGCSTMSVTDFGSSAGVLHVGRSVVPPPPSRSGVTTYTRPSSVVPAMPRVLGSSAGCCSLVMEGDLRSGSDARREERRTSRRSSKLSGGLSVPLLGWSGHARLPAGRPGVHRHRRARRIRSSGRGRCAPAELRESRHQVGLALPVVAAPAAVAGAGAAVLPGHAAVAPGRGGSVPGRSDHRRGPPGRRLVGGLAVRGRPARPGPAGGHGRRASATR